MPEPAPRRRQILHTTYQACILGWVARTGLLIATSRNPTFQLIMLPLWAQIYAHHHKLHQTQTPTHAPPRPAEWWLAGLYVLMTTYLWTTPHHWI